MTDRVRHLLQKHHAAIESNAHRGFSNFLLDVRDNMDSLSLSELDLIKAAIFNYGEQYICYSARHIVSEAEGFIYNDHFMEGDDYHIRPVLWDLVIMNDLGLCDHHKVSAFFDDFRSWLSKIHKLHRRAIHDVLVEEGLAGC